MNVCLRVQQQTWFPRNASQTLFRHDWAGHFHLHWTSLHGLSDVVQRFGSLSLFCLSAENECKNQTVHSNEYLRQHKSALGQGKGWQVPLETEQGVSCVWRKAVDKQPAVLQQKGALLQCLLTTGQPPQWVYLSKAAVSESVRLKTCGRLWDAESKTSNLVCKIGWSTVFSIG